MVDLEQKLLLGSTLCKQADFSASWYNRWRRQIANAAHELDPESRPVWDTVWRGMTDTIPKQCTENFGNGARSPRR